LKCVLHIGSLGERSAAADQPVGSESGHSTSGIRHSPTDVACFPKRNLRQRGIAAKPQFSVHRFAPRNKMG
jgi:hypothetical protein